MINRFEYVTEPVFFKGLSTVDHNEMADVYRCSIYENIEERTVAGENMIFIPKVYVAHRLVKNNPAWFIADHPREGYHLHPAFFNNGVETPNGILIGKYPACIEKKDGSFARGKFFTDFYDPEYPEYGYESINDVAGIHSRDENWSEQRWWYYHGAEDFVECIALKNSDPSSSDASGWHLFNIYEHALLQRLALIATETTELGRLYQPFGLVFTSTDYVKGEWLYGAGLVKSGDNFYWRILNNTQSAFVNTEALLTPMNERGFVSGCYAKSVHDNVGADYDTRDLFLPNDFVFWDDESVNSGYPAAYFGLDQTYDIDKPSGDFYPYAIGFGLSFALDHGSLAEGVHYIGDNQHAAFGRIAKFC